MKKKLYFVVLIFSIIYTTTCYEEPHTECDPIENSFNLCISSKECVYNYGLDQNGMDKDSFKFQFNVAMSVYNIDENGCKFMACPKDKPDTEEEYSSSGEDIIKFSTWLKLITSYKHCKNNQYFDPEVGCVCRPGKICKFEPAEDYLPSVYQHKWIAALILALLVTIIIFMPIKLAELWNFLEEFAKKQNISLHEEPKKKSSNTDNSKLVHRHTSVSDPNEPLPFTLPKSYF